MPNLPRHGSQESILRQARERLARRDLKGAAALYSQALAKDRQNIAALQGMGVVRLHERRFSDAAKFLRQALKQNHRSAELNHLMGFALTGMEEFAGAVPFYEQALLLQPGQAQVLNNLGYALHKLGREEEALARFEEALALAPAYAEAHNNRGNALAALGRLADATAAYDRAASLSFPDARNNLVKILADQGYGSGRDEPRLKTPLDAGMLIEIGNIYLDAENFSLARNLFSRVRILDRGNIAARTGLARALHGLGDVGGARSLFEELLREGVRTTEVLVALSNMPPAPNNAAVLAAIEQGRKGAEKQSRLVLHFAQARMLHNLGRYEEAWATTCEANARLWKERRAVHEADLRKQAAELARLQSLDPGPLTDDPDYPVSLFILGTSRSGKTTCETLVASLDGVARSFESPLLTYAERAARAVSGHSRDAGLDELTPQARAFYFDTLRRIRVDAPVLTTTVPGDVWRIPWIAATLPNARFLFVQRDPDDTVLRMLMKLYRDSHAYAYHPRAAYQHIAWYHAMIDTLAGKFPAISRVISYERIVTDPMSVLRETAALCGLTAAALPESVAVPGDDRGCAAPYREWMRAMAGPR